MTKLLNGWKHYRRKRTVPYDVIFERKVGDHWEPTHSDSLTPGEVVRMKEVDGDVIGGECIVRDKNGSDSDSRFHYDLSLEAL
jgi:hypothetical protein